MSLLVTAYVWLMRILVRQYLSHVHLEADAIERRTMITTYRALLRRGDVDVKDLQLVLQYLFRNSKLGIMKDDGNPVSSIHIGSNMPK